MILMSEQPYSALIFCAVQVVDIRCEMDHAISALPCVEIDPRDRHRPGKPDLFLVVFPGRIGNGLTIPMAVGGGTAATPPDRRCRRRARIHGKGSDNSLSGEGD
jgi:hypothetical protein